MAPNCSLPCPANWSTFSGPQVGPDPDIAGTGVLVAFVATAYITLLLVFTYYILGYVEPQFLNSIDHSFLRIIWRFPYIKTPARSALALRKAVLMFSDQQAVSGIALLVSGYVQVPCDINVYHWQMLVYLVWFSSSTHLSTLTVLRQYFRDKAAIRSWRVVLMLATVTMLAVALLPTGDENWHLAYGAVATGHAGVPVRCFLPHLAPANIYSYAHGDGRDAEQKYTMIVSTLILFFGYVTRLVKLSRRATDFAEHWLRAAPGNLWRQWMDKWDTSKHPGPRRLHWQLVHFFLETIYASLHAYYEVFGSMLLEILWLSLVVAWGTVRLFKTRALIVPSEEWTWGFSQVLPLVLLALPMLSIGEYYFENTSASKTTDTSNVNYAVEDTDKTALVDFSKRPTILKIGEWPLPSSSQSATSTAESTLPQITTEWSHSKHGSITTTPLDSVLPILPCTVEQTAGTATLSPRPPNQNRYDQSEWFQLLIAFIFTLLLELAIFVIGARADINNAGILFLAALLWVVCYTVAHVGGFLALTRLHGPIGDFVQRYARVPRRVQRALLRSGTYVAVLAMLVFGTLLDVDFIGAYKQFITGG